MDFTGERFIPGVKGPIASEHQHRYVLASHLVAGRSVLDVACGEGYGSALLGRSAASVVGLDLDPETITHARRKYIASENVTYQEGDVSNLSFADSTFDVVISFETIEHVQDPRRALRELKRVLKPDGLLIVSTPNRTIYTDNLGNRNQYHPAELTIEEVSEELTSMFSHVHIYGQRVGIASTIKQLPNASILSTECWWLNETGPSRSPGEETWPVYVVALCSNASLAEFAPSALIDTGQGGANTLEELQAWGNGLYVALEEARNTAKQERENLTSRIMELEAAAAQAPSINPLGAQTGKTAKPDYGYRNLLLEQRGIVENQARTNEEHKELITLQATKIAEQSALLTSQDLLLNERQAQIENQARLLEKQQQTVATLHDAFVASSGKLQRLSLRLVSMSQQTIELDELRSQLEAKGAALVMAEPQAREDVQRLRRKFDEEICGIRQASEAEIQEWRALVQAGLTKMDNIACRLNVIRSISKEYAQWMASYSSAAIAIASQNENLKSYIAAVLASTSWKVSAPIRLWRRLSGGGGHHLHGLLVDIPLPALQDPCAVADKPSCVQLDDFMHDNGVDLAHGIADLELVTDETINSIQAEMEEVRQAIAVAKRKYDDLATGSTVPDEHGDFAALLGASPIDSGTGTTVADNSFTIEARQPNSNDASDRPAQAIADSATANSARLVQRSGVFDVEWYAQTYSVEPHEAIVHYLTAGHLSGYNPNPLFDGQDYLARHPDVSAAGMNPLLHYLVFGAREGRELIDKSCLSASIELTDEFWANGLPLRGENLDQRE